MANTEIIKIDEREFRVFRKVPIPITRKLYKMMIDMAADFEGSIDDLQSGNIKAKDAKGIDLDIFYEIQDLLLTEVVISPQITQENIQDINNDLQPYLQELADKLFDKITDERSSIKKKSMT